MGLMLNVDPEVRRGDVIQCFEIEHEGEKLMIKVYVIKATGIMKLTFNGPKSFGISRFKEPLTSTSRDHDGSPSSKA